MAIHSATARNIKRTSSTDLTRTLAEQRSHTHRRLWLLPFWMQGVQRVSTQPFCSRSQRLRAGSRPTQRIDIFGNGAVAIHEADLAREPEEIWGKAWLEPFSGSDSSVRRWLSCCTRSRQEQNIGAQERPAHCYIIGCGTFGLPKGTVEGSAPASRGLLPHPCLGGLRS